MRILFLNYEYPPLGGGAANASYYFLKELDALSCAPIVDAIVSSEDTYKIERIGNNTCIHKLDIGKTSNLHYQSSADILNYLVKSALYIKKLMTSNKYDLVHAFFAIPCGLLTLYPARNIPYVISLRGSDVPGYSDRYHLLYPMIKPVFRHICINAYAVVANSMDLANLANKSIIDKKPVVTIQNGVDTTFFKPKVKEYYSDNITIVSAGRLINRKGIDVVVNTVAYLVARGVNITANIAGDGPLKDELIALAQKLSVSDRIIFHGNCTKERLLDLYQSSDIFILPSANEGMSNSLLEAMACGLPIITTNTGGAEDLLQGCGTIVKRDDYDTIMNTITKIAQNKDVYDTMSRNSREKALKMNWKVVSESYLDIYRKAIE